MNFPITQSVATLIENLYVVEQKIRPIEGILSLDYEVLEDRHLEFVLVKM